MSIEPRRIKKIVRKIPRLTSKEVAEIALGDAEAEEVKQAQPPKHGKPYKARRAMDGHVFALTKPRVVDGYVTLTQLASERGIQPQLARIWLKGASWKKPGDRWAWKERSQTLTRVRKALGLQP